MTNIKSKAWRNDGIAKVTGRAKYSDDLKFHDMLHAVPVYTDQVHAKILSIDTSKAEQAPGVVKVITAKDVPGHSRWGQVIRDHDMFVTDKVRYAGDVIALVVAKTRPAALAARDKISVQYEPLPIVTDPIKAMEKDAPLIHAERKDNIINHHKIRRGDTETAFKNCAHIIEKDFTTTFVEHAYMEPESAVCLPRHDGVIEAYGSMQHPFVSRQFCAAILGKPLTEIEVYLIATGGGFGGKHATAAIVTARTALAAYLTGKPVKMTYDREWSMRESYKRHPYRMHYKMGLTNDGKIQAVECRMVADGGAYASVTPFVTWRSTVQCCGPYVVPNVHCDVYGVYTNNVFTADFRGFGAPQVNFAIEQLIEIAAEKIGLTEIEIRQRNMLKQNDETITCQKLNTHTVSLSEAFTKTTTAIDYANKVKNCSYGKSTTDELYGIGLSIGYRGISLGAEGKDFCCAIINGQFDGSILLEVGVHENGQGLESAMILQLVEELGVKRERIRYRRPSTANIGDSGATVATRGTIMGSGAVVNAAKELKQQMAAILAPLLNCKPEEVTYKDDCLYGKTAKDRLTWDDAVQKMFLKQSYPYAFGVFQAPQVDWDEEHGRGNAYFTWVYECHAAELTVNKKTGKIKLLNYVATHDVGKAINKSMVLGQIYGGISQGIGMALTEKLTIENGKILSDNFDRYRIPRTTDMPEITAFILENCDPNSPSGAKGIGEPALEIVAPAIANAVYRATGKRHFELPIKIEI